MPCLHYTAIAVMGSPVLFTLRHSGHLVGITGGLRGVQTIKYNIIVELAGHTINAHVLPPFSVKPFMTPFIIIFPVVAVVVVIVAALLLGVTSASHGNPRVCSHWL